MIGRVTQSMMSDQLLGNVRRLQRRLVDTQDALSSGKTLRRASDDPAGAAVVNGLRAQSKDLKSLSRTIGFGTAFAVPCAMVIASMWRFAARRRKISCTATRIASSVLP